MNLNKRDNKDVSNIQRIQGTNDNSILSKCSMIKYGYFEDPFLPFMIRKFSRRAPLINRGYYIRAKAIDYLLHNFIKYHENQMIQIVSLGAGFDTSFFRLTTSGKLSNCCFVEIDYFDVAQRKVSLVQQEPLLWNCFKEPITVEKNNYIILNAANYKLLGVDITKLDVVDACIRASGISYDVPTLFLSECVITYISTKKAFNLLKFIAKSFSQNTFILYEQINPDDGFGRFMCQHFQQLGSSLRGIAKYKTKQDQIKRFMDAGWEYANGCDMAEFYYDIIDSDEKSRVENLEVFDEYEEWLQKCCHYVVLVATKGMQWTPRLSSKSLNVSQEENIVQTASKQLHLFNYQSDKSEVVSKGGVKAHYARSALIYSDNGNECLIRVSGYGQNPFAIGHCRLASISILDIETKIMTHIIPEHSELLLNSLCGSMTKLSNNSFLLFGGRSSPLKPNNSFVSLNISFNEDSSSWKAVCNDKVIDNPLCTPSARWRHAAAVYWLHDNPFFLVYGGRNSSPTPLSDTYVFDLEHNQWSSLSSDVSCPGPLCGGAAVSLANSSLKCTNQSPDICCGCCCVLLFGGLRSSDLVPSGELWRWCGRKRSWTRVLVEGDMLYPRFSHTAHRLLDHQAVSCCQSTSVRFLSLGGVSHKTAECGRLSVVTVDLFNNTARNQDYIIKDNNNLECVLFFNHCGAISERSFLDNRLWMLGGGGNCFSFGTQLNENIYYIDIDDVEV